MLRLVYLVLLLFITTNSLNALNLLKNPSFEFGANGWDSYQAPIKTSADSYVGVKSITFKTGGMGQATGLLPNIKSINGTNKYVLSGHYKHVGVVEGTWFGVVHFDSNWEVIGESDSALAKSSKYKKFELLTTPPAGTHYMVVWFWSDAVGGGVTFLDDLKLSPKVFDYKPCKLLYNGDFDNSLSGWDVYGAKSLYMNKSVLISDGGMDQSIYLYEGGSKTYHFKGEYKTDKTPDGTWAGMNFYDQSDNLILTKSVALKATNSFKKFTVNATAPNDVYYVQTWIWTEAGADKGEVILDKLSLSEASCANFVAPSSLPPHGISIDDAPQFVVLGFDDNTISQGIYWAADLFNNKKNKDNSDASASFYMNTIGFDVWGEDNPADLLTAVKAINNQGFEIANHTHNHHKGISNEAIRNFNYNSWNTAIVDGESRLFTDDAINLVGFRSPYLLYNQNLLNVLKNRGYLYDCSIEEGHDSRYDGTNFRWPYQLNEGSPGHDEGWYGNPANADNVHIDGVEGLWELPVYVLMIPKDNECAFYGIESGLWGRITVLMPYLSDYKITSFDYNLWHLAELNKSEVLGILKYNLDLRLQGNKAPFTFGTHAQYYTDAWSHNAPNASTIQMREAIEEFIAYALTKSEVRVTTAEKVIKWCEGE